MTYFPMPFIIEKPLRVITDRFNGNHCHVHGWVLPLVIEESDGQSCPAIRRPAAGTALIIESSGVALEFSS